MFHELGIQRPVSRVDEDELGLEAYHGDAGMDTGVVGVVCVHDVKGGLNWRDTKKVG